MKDIGGKNIYSVNRFQEYLDESKDDEGGDHTTVGKGLVKGRGSSSLRTININGYNSETLPDNSIKTSKYTRWNFLPKNLII